RHPWGRARGGILARGGGATAPWATGAGGGGGATEPLCPVPLPPPVGVFSFPLGGPRRAGAAAAARRRAAAERRAGAGRSRRSERSCILEEAWGGAARPRLRHPRRDRPPFPSGPSAQPRPRAGPAPVPNGPGLF